jgi:hypothetical protein
MRKQFLHVKSYQTARKRAPWAAKIVRAEGGFWAFESVHDWDIYRMASVRVAA